ncbi:MAG TPA: hypothetical protein VMV10_17575 [Pirellulales bacterium]|nr:hypothetical protein [Pirellulales bacterium]
MDKQARQLMDELLAFKSKAEQSAQDPRAAGEKMLEAIDCRQKRLEQGPAENRDEARDD